MYNTRYLPENFKQWGLEKTTLRHFPYNSNVRSRCIALIQDGGKNHERAYMGSLYSHIQIKHCKKGKILQKINHFVYNTCHIESHNCAVKMFDFLRQTCKLQCAVHNDNM